MKKKLLFSLVSLFCFSLFTLIILRARADHGIASHVLPTYFSYSTKDAEDLKKLSSSFHISAQNLKKWDQIAYELSKQAHYDFYQSERLFTYLYAAQRDAAFLSYNAKDSFEGSLDPVSYGVITLFFSNLPRPTEWISDAYSEKMASLVLSKYTQRLEQENASKNAYCLPQDLFKNPETSYESGLSVAKWSAWAAKPIDQYLAPPPPPAGDPVWTKEIKEIKSAQKKISKSQLQAVYWWAGMTHPEDGDWRKIANDYMYEIDAPVGKMMLVRDMLMKGQYDATIACTDSKYLYLAIRPHVRDPSMTYLLECPKHPSYPSGHSTLAGSAYAILSYYFPEHIKEWKRLSEEAGLSRIWAGIHYPMDNKIGYELGEKVGEKVIEGGEREGEITLKDLFMKTYSSMR